MKVRWLTVLGVLACESRDNASQDGGAEDGFADSVSETTDESDGPDIAGSFDVDTGSLGDTDGETSTGSECSRDQDCPSGGSQHCFVGVCLDGNCLSATRSGRCDFFNPLDGICIAGVCIAALSFFADSQQPVVPAAAECECRDAFR